MLEQAIPRITTYLENADKTTAFVNFKMKNSAYKKIAKKEQSTLTNGRSDRCLD